MLQISAIPAFQDNYLWVIHDERRAVVVDPGDPAPVEAFLAARHLELVGILNTHHHGDHTGGNLALAARRSIPVWGPAQEDIPGRTSAARDGDTVDIPELALQLQVLAVPGHTAGHIAYYGPGMLFCGDTLFGCGCGRLFEGTAAQMWQSLSRLSALPPETLVYCAHEYTLANIAFALHVDPDNAALQARARHDRERRRDGLATVPFSIALERATNPFLRSGDPALGSAVRDRGEGPATPGEEVFARLRRWKDGFTPATL